MAHERRLHRPPFPEPSRAGQSTVPSLPPREMRITLCLPSYNVGSVVWGANKCWSALPKITKPRLVLRSQPPPRHARTATPFSHPSRSWKSGNSTDVGYVEYVTSNVLNGTRKNKGLKPGTQNGTSNAKGTSLWQQSQSSFKCLCGVRSRIGK